MVPAGRCGCGPGGRRGTCPDTVVDVGFLDRLKKLQSHDEASIRQMLEAEGTTAEQAQEIVEILSRRMSHDDMHIWLSHPEKSHGIPDPDSEEKFGVVLNWTPINAVSAGKTALVIDEARRFVEADAPHPR